MKWTAILIAMGLSACTMPNPNFNPNPKKPTTEVQEDFTPTPTDDITIQLGPGESLAKAGTIDNTKWNALKSTTYSKQSISFSNGSGMVLPSSEGNFAFWGNWTNAFKYKMDFNNVSSTTGSKNIPVNIIGDDYTLTHIDYKKKSHTGVMKLRFLSVDKLTEMIFEDGKVNDNEQSKRNHYINGVQQKDLAVQMTTKDGYLQSLKIRNIVPMTGSFTLDDPCSSVSEYVKSGTMLSYNWDIMMTGTSCNHPAQYRIVIDPK